MATREELYRAFGPKLIEALALVVKEEINIVRASASLPERTNQQIVNAIEIKLQSIPNFPWQDLN
jgi:hypothetical protein